MDIKSSGILGAFLGLIGTVGFLAVSNEGGISALSGAPLSLDGEAEFCLISDAPYFQDLSAGCYTKSVLRSLYTTDLVNERGANVVVTMSSPPEVPAATDECRTCADYARMQRLGWFALSGRDQRREEFFRRACSVLDYLTNADAVENSYFDDRSLSAADIAAIPDTSLLLLGRERRAGRERGPVPQRTRENPQEAGTNSLWEVSLGQNKVTIQPLSHADFDQDGIADMLVYMRTIRVDGTAFAGVVGYLKKTNNDGVVQLILDQ